MKDILKEIEGDKLLLKIPIDIYEKEATLKASYKFTNKCYINIEVIENVIEVLFQAKEDNNILKEIALEFGNELIDQQIRLNTGREYKVIREELVKKAFNSISK
ncbi:MAG: His-Xaa-Ser system protein HxsD [Bacteroidales bacterium]|nr:His-Xaa-Ser system protein HxsD [Bacteroidales bacterium]